MSEIYSNHSRNRRSAGLNLRLWLTLGLIAVGLGCGSSGEDSAARVEGTPESAGQASVAGYRMQVRPFSPTLAHLFDQGRIIVMPAGEDSVANAAMGDDPVFSALDRYGRVYHFDRRGAWAMDEGEVLPAALPPGQWDAAWNESTEAIEILVSAPWLDSNDVQLLRRRDGRWCQADVRAAPQGCPGAHRLFLSATGHWIVAGGDREASIGPDTWLLKDDQWTAWGGALAGDSDESDAASAFEGPRIENALFLIEGPSGDDLGLIDREGVLWLWMEGVWSREATMPVEGLTLARYDRHLGKALFVWTGAFGENQVLALPLVRGLGDGKLSLMDLSQLSQLTINGQEEGVWQAWGWARSDGEDGSRDFKPGLEGEGEPALVLDVDQGAVVIRRSQIHMVETPPRPDLLRPRGAAYVPGLGGIVVPSAHGLGMDAGPGNFFPKAMIDAMDGDSVTSPAALTRRIDVVERTPRFWIFKGDLLDYFKPLREVHPAIGYAHSYQKHQQSRYLSWSYPDNGLISFEYREESPEKVQWNRSPVLTLRDLPALDQAGEIVSVSLCDPVVWGDPAEVVLVGWAGPLGRQIKLKDHPEGLGNEARTQVPSVGFVARIDALNPLQWQVTSLPIPYVEGGKLVVAPDRDCLYLVGGKMAVPHEFEGRNLSFMVSHSLVWQFDGKLWSRIEPGGVSPRMKVTSHMAYDPIQGMLLTLTPRALYGFKDRLWSCLWEREKVEGEQWPTEVGLYVHPLSNLTLGAWFMPRPEFKVWDEGRWLPVVMDLGRKGAEAEAVAWQSCDILPTLQSDAFVSVDAQRLTAIRMDEARERSEDRFLTGNMVELTPEKKLTDVKPEAALPPDIFRKKERLAGVANAVSGVEANF